MKPLDCAHAWPGGHGLVVLGLTIALALSGACSTPAPKDDKPVENQVIGKPPEAEEDPFFVERMPGEAVEASPRGSIGDDDEDATQDTDQTEEADQTEETEDSREREEQSEVASRAPERQVPERQAPERQASDQPQCFSCVRICPSEGDCDQAKDDVICGWGVHDTADEAKRMAKAECDATLDMARQMPVWSEIAGDCPVATCR